MNFKQWVSKQELETDIINSKDPKIAVFAASWCGFCRRFIETIKSYNPKDSNYSDMVFVVDTDSEDGSLWDKYKIDIVPTIVVFRDSKEIFRRDGKAMRGLSRQDLEEVVEAVIHSSSKLKESLS